MHLSAMLSDDRNTATFTLTMDGHPLGHIILEPPDVEDLIQKAAAIRASMAESVPNEIEPTARLLAADDPIWNTKIPTSSPGPRVLLTFRHPGLGWLANLLPREEARKLGQSLLDLSREL